MKLLDYLSKKEENKLIYKSFKKNDVLFYEHDICNEICIVKSGSLIIKSTLINGQEIVYRKLLKDEVFGATLLFSNDETYKGDVICLEDSEIVLISKNNLINLLLENKDFLIQYLKIESTESINAHKKIRLLSLNKAEDRVLYFLQINNNSVKYESITSLSKEIGLERETLSRTLTKLIKNKKIIKNNKIISIYKAKDR